MVAEHDFAKEPLPVGQLGTGSDVVRQVVATGHPQLLTEDGVAVAVILDIAAYREMQRETGVRELRESLLAASAQVDRGEVVLDEEVRAGLHARFAGRITPELLDELVRE